jgi:hypothetical protein
VMCPGMTDDGAMCSGHGACHDGVCVCDAGEAAFTGIGCETPSPCPYNCNGNGMCNMETAKCECSDGYSGEFCSKDNSTTV